MIPAGAPVDVPGNIPKEVNPSLRVGTKEVSKENSPLYGRDSKLKLLGHCWYHHLLRESRGSVCQRQRSPPRRRRIKYQASCLSKLEDDANS